MLLHIFKLISLEQIIMTAEALRYLLFRLTTLFIVHDAYGDLVITLKHQDVSPSAP